MAFADSCLALAEAETTDSTAMGSMLHELVRLELLMTCCSYVLRPGGLSEVESAVASLPAGQGDVVEAPQRAFQRFCA